MSERFQELELGFVPELAVPGPILMAADEQAIISFNISEPPDIRAVIKIPALYQLRFGSPAGEELNFEFVEVLDSEWLKSLCTATPHLQRFALKHFRIAFHDSSFEFLAPGFEHELHPVETFELNDMVKWVDASH